MSHACQMFERGASFADWHKWLCHPGLPCEDGCDKAAMPDRLAIYNALPWA